VNFTACSQSQISHSPRYFESSWHLQELDTIDKNSSVCIVGSWLSVIDAAIHIANNGHEGPLKFVSRSGGLPQVQGRHPAASYDSRYLLHIMARDMEEKWYQSNTLEDVMERFKSFA
jgi:uncharacterized NAD(P)/FAD-binding protein YdhS